MPREADSKLLKISFPKVGSSRPAYINFLISGEPLNSSFHTSISAAIPASVKP